MHDYLASVWRRFGMPVCLLGCLYTLSGCWVITRAGGVDSKTIPLFVTDVDYELIRDVKIDLHPGSARRLFDPAPVIEESHRQTGYGPIEVVAGGTRLRYARLIRNEYLGGSLEQVAMTIQTGPYAGTEVFVSPALTTSRPAQGPNTYYKSPDPKYLRMAENP